MEGTFIEHNNLFFSFKFDSYVRNLDLGESRKGILIALDTLKEEPSYAGIFLYDKDYFRNKISSDELKYFDVIKDWDIEIIADFLYNSHRKNIFANQSLGVEGTFRSYKMKSIINSQPFIVYKSDCLNKRWFYYITEIKGNYFVFGFFINNNQDLLTKDFMKELIIK